MLKKTLKHLIKDSAFYGAGNAISKSLQLITLPIVVTSVSDADFSNWNMIQATTAIIAGLLLFGMDSAAARFYYDTESPLEKRKVFTTSFLVQAMVSIIVLPLCFIAINPLENISGIDTTYRNDFIILLLWMPASALSNFFIGWFKWTFQKWNFLILSFGFAFLNLALLFYFMYKGELTINIVVKITLLCQWLVVLYAIIISKKFFIKSISKELSKKLIKYGAPLMIVAVLGIFRMSMDRYFLVHQVNERVFAMYSFAQKLSMIILLAVTAFDFAFNPLIFSMWNQAGAKEVFSKIQSLFTIGMVGICLFVMSCSVPLIVLMGKQSFIEATTFLPFMLFANSAYGFINFAFIGINYSKKTYLLIILILLAVGSMALFNVLFISIWTVYAAAASLLIANIILVALGYFLSSKLYPIPFNFKKDLSMFFVGLIISFPFGLIQVHTNIYLDAGIKLFISIILFLTLIRLFYRAELKLVISKVLRKQSNSS